MYFSSINLHKKLIITLRGTVVIGAKAAVSKLNGHILPFGKLKLSKLSNAWKVTQVVIKEPGIHLQVSL